MLRQAALALWHEVHQQPVKLLWAGSQCLRSYASRRTQPAWMTNKPRVNKEEKALKARIKKLLREVDRSSELPAAASPSISSTISSAPFAAAPSSSTEASATSTTSTSSSSPEAAVQGEQAAAPPGSAEGAAASTSTTTSSGSNTTGSSGDSSSTTTTSSSSSTSSNSSSTTDSGSKARSSAAASSWIPSFLRSIIPGISPQPTGPRRSSPLMAQAPSELGAGARDLEAKAAAAAAQQRAQLAERDAVREAAAKAAAKAGEDKIPDPWDQVTMLKDLTLDEYMQQVLQWKGDPPVPAAPKRHGGDTQRIQYLRWSQHLAICGSMTDNEKALIRFDPVAAANNRTLLAALSVRSGYNMSEVRDVMVVYDEVRSQINSLASWKERGEEMPSISDSEARLKIVEKVKKEKEQADLDILLARRDRANCPLKGYVRVLGRRAECPNTKLPYMHCCGAKKPKAEPAGTTSATMSATSTA